MADAAHALKYLQEQVGKELGVSDWVRVDQNMIDAFGEVTRDPDPMHVDPEWCAKHSPFVSTVAFGFMTMSLITHLFHNVMHYRSNAEDGSPNYGLNYGFDRLRLVAPVPVGSDIRGRFVLAEWHERAPGEIIQGIDVTIEIKGGGKPALVGRWLTMIVSDEGHRRISDAAAS